MLTKELCSKIVATVDEINIMFEDLSGVPMHTIISKFMKQYLDVSLLFAKISNKLERLEGKYEIEKSKSFKSSLANNKQGLSSRDTLLTLEGQPELVTIRDEINELKYYHMLISNTKDAMKTLHYQLTNLSKLIVANMDEYSI